jgi:origin recognition complex subunit 2
MDCVVINGYFPSLTIKSVLNTITEEILGTEDTFSSNTEHVAHILRYVEPEQ